jgi:hypothetical protein
VYEGRFRVVQRDVVLEDIKAQVEAGARHITFGDPDFFNGPGHAIPIVKALHQHWPELTYDVTIKIEHLLKHSHYLPTLRDTGCLFVTSAVESIDNYVLEIFDKNHTRDDFIKVVSMFREIGLILNPTFVTFTPWTSVNGYRDLLTLIDQLDLVNNVSPIQYAIRLLIPVGSKLLELPLVQELVGKFDEASLCYLWSHPDPEVDRLHADVLNIVKKSQSGNGARQAIFKKVWGLVHEPHGAPESSLQFSASSHGPPGAPIPCLSEPWYC